MRLQRLAALGALGAVAGLAQAQTVLQFDINALSAQATGQSAFNQAFTGTVNVFNTAANPDRDGDAEILDVLIDGVAQETGGASASEFSFSLTIDFDGGFITGGSVELSIDQSGSENTYTASLAPSAVRNITNIGGGNFLLGGLTFDGVFTNPNGTMLGVDISPWGDLQPLPGRFAQIRFSPDRDGFDEDTDVDLFVLVPTPAAAGMAMLGLGGLGVMRRRR